MSLHRGFILEAFGGLHLERVRSMSRADPTSSGLIEGLAQAVIRASETPTLLLGADTIVRVASQSFGRSFGFDPERLASSRLADLGQGEWAVPQLEALLLATLAGHAAIDGYEMDLHRPARPVQNLRLSARKLDIAGGEGPLVLLSITDQTEARRLNRQKDVLVQEKAVLFQELQHRIANSLQIIASVLLQSARTVKIDEARLRISEAHDRVMSVAALQHQLAASQLEDVELEPYLVSLCRSLGASMIRDPAKVTIRVDVPSVVIPANVSLCLGLIVTELIINALKHAFLEDGRGTIEVAYAVAGSGWALTVRDDGVGMPTGGAVAPSGLGTRIVTALVQQVGAEIRVSEAGPGTLVRISGQTPSLSGSGSVLAAV